ncbi:MAG: response regulator, partial [Cyanobacteriota bacterium]
LTRLSVTSYLNMKNFQCDIAEDGISGLKRLSEKKYELIFSDVEMPNMNGFEFLKKVRSILAYKNIPMVMFTSLDDVETVNKIKHLGANYHMTKPYTREKMSDALNKCGF